jgi:uncharacterized membrane protein YbhN (UPF0104 family)
MARYMKKIRQIAPIALALTLFGLAVAAIGQEFKHYTFAQLLESLAAIPADDKGKAILLMVLGYIVMTGNDFLAFRYIGRRLSPGKIARASFISYALSNTVGFTIFSGTAIRYRFYTPTGVGTLAIAKAITFTHFSFWLGMLAIGGTSFLFDPRAIPRLLNLPFATLRPVGGIFLGLVGAYLGLSATVKKPLRIAGQEFSLPSFSLSLGALVVSWVDWALAAGVLYVLLPDSFRVSFLGFFGLYILAMTAAVMSNVPGGAGVFELVLLKLRPAAVSQPDLLGSLIAYRGIYNFLPLLVALVLLLGHELGRTDGK